MFARILELAKFVTQVEPFVPSKDKMLLIVNESCDDVHARITTIKDMYYGLLELLTNHFEHLEKNAFPIGKVFAPSGPPTHHANTRQ